MNEHGAWLIPIFVGSALAGGAVVLAEVLGWSDGAGGTLALLGVVVAVVLRFAMLEHAGEIPRRR